MFKWYNEESGRVYPLRAARDIFVILVFLWVLSLFFTGLTWGGQVIFAPLIGQGNARVTIESAPNRIGSQEMFVQMYADIQAYPGMIRDAQKQLDSYRKLNEGKADPLGTIAGEDSRLSTNVSGLRLNCRNAVKNYNAATLKVSKEQFKDPSLPYTVNAEQFCGGGE